MNGFTAGSAENLTLPPQHLWLIDPKREKLVTPTDDRGLVNSEEMILRIRLAIVDPDYRWTKHENIHHKQWPKAWYPAENANFHDPTNPAAFQHLPVNRVWLPMDMHKLLHIIMEPPPLPESDVMFYRVEAWNVARSLFMKARPLVFLPRRFHSQQALLKIDSEAIERPVQDASIMKAINVYLALVEQMQPQIERIPPEFRIVQPDQLNPEEVARAAGRVVVPKAQPSSLTVGLQLAA